MPYPTQDELLAADPLDEWIDEHFLRSDPVAFEGVGFWPTVATVARLLEVDVNGIYCVGSGAVGFSLNPQKVMDGDLKPFDEHSDIDLAVISEVHFESAWRDLRRAAQPLLQSEMEAELAENLNWQKKRFFEGIILANKLLPHLEFGPSWLSGINQIEEAIAIDLNRSIPLNVWIFRDYWSLRTYITKSALLCREKVA